MSKKPLILGIETSCDETAASIITENDKGIPTVLSNIVSSQVDVHKEFGGVVPELAARSHIEKIDWIVEKAISDSGKKIEEIDAVASTAGPGLIVCLSVGLSFGKAFAKAFPKLKPTDKQTIKPGPAVEATASISSIFFPLSEIAFSTIQSIFSICDLAASSGTTPPNSL